MAVAVEGVGHEVERPEAGQLVEGPRCDAADPVAVQGESLEVDEAAEHLAVDLLDLVL